MHSKASPTRCRAALRRLELLQMVARGMSYAAIGRQLGISRQRVHFIVSRELRKLW
jgi:DNA-binding NarL/FixJ family response regulator